MKKLFIIIPAAIVLIVCGGALLIWYNLYNSNFQLKGDLIVISNTSDNCIINHLDKGTKTTIHSKGFGSVEFSASKAKFLSCKIASDEKTSIIEEKIRDKTNKVLITVDNAYNLDTIPQYRPQSDEISFISGKTFCLYNTKTRKIRYISGLADAIDSYLYNYSWNSDGMEIAYFDSQGFVELYNLNNNSSVTMFRGGTPTFSKDGKYIAFQSDGNLFVYSMISGKTKNLGKHDFERLSFSPDDNYIAIGHGFLDFLDCDETRIQVVNIKTGATKTILKNNDASLSFDWQ